MLLFSRSVRMLSMVKALVTKHGWAYEYLDGSIPEVTGKFTVVGSVPKDCHYIACWPPSSFANRSETNTPCKSVQSQRQKKVDEFNNTPSTFIFMISTRAGGLGLNLTSANK